MPRPGMPGRVQRTLHANLQSGHLSVTNDSGTPGSESRPLRVAIIGAGPAGFFAADSLLKRPDLVCSVDMFNKFPSPHGLVREGVAPDHQKIKNVIRIFDRTASDERFRYFGNVTFGEDVTHDDLKPYYDQIIYAVGALP